jgi:hypothetical protein
MQSNSIALTAIVLGGMATAASAGACGDTLYLQSLTRTDKTYHKKGAAIDSATVQRSIPLDSLVLAAPAPVPSMLGQSDTLYTLLAFAPDCGTDSVSQVRLFRVVDSFSKDGMGNVKRQVVGTESSQAMRASSYADPGRILPTGETVLFQQAWWVGAKGAKNPTWEPVVPPGGASAIVATSFANAWIYSANSVQTSMFPHAVDYLDKGSQASMQRYRSYYIDTLLTKTSSDSALVVLRAYQGLYSFTRQSYEQGSSGIIAQRVDARSAISLQRLADGWRLTTATAAAGFVRDPQGRLLRSFPATTSFDWDGRTQNGRTAGHGIYLLGFEGQGTRVLALP